MRRAAQAALALAAVLGASLPPGQGAPPLEQPWRVDLAALKAGPAAALAFDEAGLRGLVGTGDAGPVPSDSDLVLVRFEDGNATAEPDSPSLVGEGKLSVAVSPDGGSAVAGGAYAASSLAGPNVFFYALPDLAPAWTRSLAEPVAGVAVGLGGNVVVVGTRTGAQGPGKLYRFDGEGTQRWQRAVADCGPSAGSTGSVEALDLSRDGRWLVAGTGFVAGNETRGCVLLFDTATLNPVAAFEVRPTGALRGGNVTAVDVSPDGAWYAAGAAGGQLLVFQNAPGAREQPRQSQLPSLAPVVAVRVARDGSAVAVADEGSVGRYVQRAGLLVPEWSVSLEGVRSLDATPDGEFLLAGASRLVAFQRSGNRTLWEVEVPDALVRIAQPGASDVRVLAAGGGQVRGFRLHWALEVRKMEPEPVQVPPGQARPYLLELFNNGSASDLFELGASSEGFLVDLEPAQAELGPGEAQNVTLTLTPRPGAEAKLYNVGLVATGARSGVETRATVLAALGAMPLLSIAVADPADRDRAVFQGDDADIALVVQNRGNARLELAYDLVQRPNVGEAWDASLSRTSAVVEAGGISGNTLRVRVPADARNGTENLFTITARGEAVSASERVRLVVNPIVTGSVQVIPQSKVVAPGKSAGYQVVAANNGTLRQEYRLVFCVAQPELVPCIGNATQGLGGWSVALDTSAFPLDQGQSRTFSMAVAAPRGAIPGVDRLQLQVELVSTNPLHLFRDFRLVTTSVEEEAPPTRPPAVTPGFEAALAALALGFVVALAAARRR